MHIHTVGVLTVQSCNVNVYPKVTQLECERIVKRFIRNLLACATLQCISKHSDDYPFLGRAFLRRLVI